MEPKEKAKELVNKYLQVYDGRVPQAKLCTLILVDEILQFGNELGIREPMMYWNSVKQEINKL
jgi:hypothetical protein